MPVETLASQPAQLAGPHGGQERDLRQIGHREAHRERLGRLSFLALCAQGGEEQEGRRARQELARALFGDRPIENCSVSGKLSWRDAQRKWDTTRARDGEVLVRLVPADNEFGFVLKFISVDWLDETFNEQLRNGNRVIMSVEVNADDRPVAYWLTPPASEYQFLSRREQTTRQRTRVPASEILHSFLLDDENADDDCQTRGVPWLHTAMLRLKILGAYEEAELVAARVGACKMGFFEEPSSEMYGGDQDGETGGEALMESAQPGTFGLLPNGYKFHEFSPDHPNTGYSAFTKAVLRGIASGVDVQYFSLTGDLAEVNYSSARIGLLDERDMWRGLQNFQIEHFCRPVFLAWLKSAILMGALQIRPSDYERLTEPQFQPRGWRWVDPEKEIKAHVLAIDNGLETRTEVIAEQGGDFEEKMTTLANEQQIIEQKGVKIYKKEALTESGDKTDDA